jgi:hypothetical protein
VGGAGHRQQLGKTLDDSKQNHLQKRHAPILTMPHGIFVI